MVYCFFVDPEKTSEAISPFWSPSINPYILKCKWTARDKRDQSSVTILNELPFKKTIVRTSDGQNHLLLSGQKRSLQLVFDQEIDPENTFYFEISASGPGILHIQTQAILCLDSILKRGHFLSSYCAMPARFRVTPELLYALDLDDLGFSQREIAIRIFGENTVNEGWNNVTDFVRSRTSRMLKKGRSLLEKSHLAFFDTL